MTPRDPFDADLASWLESEAQAPIPEGELDRVLAPTAGRQPRPSLLARLGSRWVTDAPPATGTGRMTRPALVPLWAVVLLLLALLVATTALMIGSRALDRPSDGGLLVYQLGNDVYLAQADGTNPRQLTTRAGDRPIGPCMLSTETGSIWAPGGRFFLCFGGSVRRREHRRQRRPPGGIRSGQWRGCNVVAKRRAVAGLDRRHADRHLRG